MKKPLFTPEQLFSLKPKTIEKRMNHYYQDTRDAKSTIQFLVALQVRDEIGGEDFSFFMKELSKEQNFSYFASLLCLFQRIFFFKRMETGLLALIRSKIIYQRKG